MKKDLEAVIKWSGSKRSVAAKLANLFPYMETFFDPFVGGGSILAHRPLPQARAGDVVAELVHLWQLVQTQPELVAKGYGERWERLQSEGHLAYYDIRGRFNRERDPLDFLFLTRTCVNGLIRFNSAGDFNNSLHHTRPGIAPARFQRIVTTWSQALQGVIFNLSDYRETLASAKRGDFVFLDPPYACNRGRYQAKTFDVLPFYQELDRLNSLGVNWMLTFDGEAGARTYDSAIPGCLYKNHFGIPTGNSPFTRLMGTAIDAVTESVYLNYNPPGEMLAQFGQNRPDPSRRRAAHEVKNYSLFSEEELQSQRYIHVAAL